MNHRNNFRRNNDQATTLWSLIDAAPSPPPLTPPLINFLKFFNPGHSYSNLSCQLNFQFCSIQDILKCEHSLRTKNILKETLAL